jgi:hypothetical protein
MKKAKKPKLKAFIILLMTGATIILTTPLVQSFIIYLLTQGCPLQGDVRQCGLDKGLENATYIMAFSALWFAVGIIILIAGLVEYFNTKKKH